MHRLREFWIAASLLAIGPACKGAAPRDPAPVLTPREARSRESFRKSSC
jgi:hypothetical protein